MRLKGGDLVKVTITTIDGKEHKLSLSSEMTISQLKTKIINELCNSLESASLCLRYAGVEL